MIVHLKKELSEAQVDTIAKDLKAVSFKKTRTLRIGYSIQLERIAWKL